MPDFGLGMKLFTRKLAADKDAMVACDIAHEDELGDDTGIREARDDSARAVYASLTELREVITGVYGGATTAKVFSGPTPEDPVVLSRFAGEVGSALGRVTFPAPRVPGGEPRRRRYGRVADCGRRRARREGQEGRRRSARGAGDARRQEQGS